MSTQFKARAGTHNRDTHTNMDIFKCGVGTNDFIRCCSGNLRKIGQNEKISRKAII